MRQSRMYSPETLTTLDTKDTRGRQHKLKHTYKTQKTKTKQHEPHHWKWTQLIDNIFVKFLSIHWHYNENYLHNMSCRIQMSDLYKRFSTIRISIVSSIWGRWYNCNIVESGVKHHNPNPIWGRLTLALLNYIICSVCCNPNPVLSSFMIYIRVSNKSDTICTPTAYSSGASELIPNFLWVSCGPISV